MVENIGRKIACVVMACLLLGEIFATTSRWKLTPDGGIVWQIGTTIPHVDHVEMSGDSLSVILRYGVNSDRSFQLQRRLVWPMLRTIPNNTHASFILDENEDYVSKLRINGKLMLAMETSAIKLYGMMEVVSESSQLRLVRTVFPSTTHPAYYEEYKLENKSAGRMEVEVPQYRSVTTSDPERGVTGSYQVSIETLGGGFYWLKPGESVSWFLRITAKPQGKSTTLMAVPDEKLSRQDLIKQWWEHLVLETPDSVLNRAFAFAKIRASESIYKTRGGYLHSPGGEAYYAAIWANDQAEYVGPFFPFLGYAKGNEASLNAYLHFARFMNPEYRPIPSSIIAEGLDIWNGAGDRGDAAMIAYGASRFALSFGDQVTAQKLWPLIEWCLEYCRRKLTPEGVVASDSDELEGRFPSGKANLCTSCLYYDALRSASFLGHDLGVSASLVQQYQEEARELYANIGNYFGCTVEGFNTYRYYEGNDVLRAWICIPLTVEIQDRARGTIDALFSPRLWTEDGLATQAGDQTFWDRSTLYALRGVLQAGETEKAIKYLQYYSQRRLLGEHVPYPVEAYPEGGQRHLSAESGLYCRIFTEGLFGLRPTGLKSFALTPHLPDGWTRMALKNVCLNGQVCDIEVCRKNSSVWVQVKSASTCFSKVIKNGQSVNVKL